MKNRKNIRDKYKPYNFSATRCHVIEIIINTAGVTRIEAKLPVYIKTLKGIYVTTRFEGNHQLVGFISLFFNGGALKSLQLPVINSKIIKHNSHPLPLNEELKPNSTIEGYFLDVQNYEFSYSIKIYLHYK